MKTAIQTNIEVGQDINNTWAIIAAEQAGSTRSNQGYVERFQKLFLAIQEANSWARQQSIPPPSVAVVPPVADFSTSMTNEQVIAQLELEKIARRNAGLTGARA